MKTTLLSLGAALCLLALTPACGGADAPDPTSTEALTKAPPMNWGTHCTKVTKYSTSWGESTDYSQMCDDMTDCQDEAPTGSGYAYGDEVVVGQTSYKDVHYFEGTCDDPQPVTCDDRTPSDDCESCQYAKCCEVVGLCEDDPNCVAIDDCVVACKDDASCAGRCVHNGQLDASRHFVNAVSCIADKCSDACQ